MFNGICHEVLLIFYQVVGIGLANTLFLLEFSPLCLLWKLLREKLSYFCRCGTLDGSSEVFYH